MPIDYQQNKFYHRPVYSVPNLVLVTVIGRFVTNHICHRRYVTKRSDMYQNYMDDLSKKI